jgi:hypothetical protein
MKPEECCEILQAALEGKPGLKLTGFVSTKK